MIRNAVLMIFTWGVALPIPFSTATAGEDHDVIMVNMEIIDVSDAYFERLGMDLETLLPKPANDFHPTPTSIENSEKVHHAHAVLTPLEKRLLHRFMKNEECHVICRPQVCTLPSQVATIQIDDDRVPLGPPLPALTHMGKDQEVRVVLELVAMVAQDGKHLVITIDGQSQDEQSQVRASVPAEKTILMCLGSHVVDAPFEPSVAILNKMPFSSHLFKSTRVNRITWHRLMFITPKVLRESKSYSIQN